MIIQDSRAELIIDGMTYFAEDEFIFDYFYNEVQTEYRNKSKRQMIDEMVADYKITYSDDQIIEILQNALECVLMVHQDMISEEFVQSEI